jgi:TRAP-type C4-dicarboxylate transport system permease large subunit
MILTVVLACVWRPAWGGRPIRTDWATRVAVLVDFVPPLLIFFVVIGTIYTGFATPTESAALGLLFSCLLAALRGRLTLAVLRAAIEGCIRTTAMTMAILLAAYFLNLIIGVIGLTARINALVQDLGLTPYQTLFLVIVLYVILGCVMETLSMMVATVPIITPVMIALGFDPVWFGILVILLIQTAMITPPVGITLFVVQGLRRRGDITDVIIGTSPFVLSLFVMIALLIAFPGIALVVPEWLGEYKPVGR